MAEPCGRFSAGGAAPELPILRRPPSGGPPFPGVCFVNRLEQRLLALWGVLCWVVQPPRGQPLAHTAGETPPSRAAACAAKTVGFSNTTVFAGAKKKKNFQADSIAKFQFWLRRVF